MNNKFILLLVTLTATSLLAGCSAVKFKSQYPEQFADNVAMVKGEGEKSKLKLTYLLRDYSRGKKGIGQKHTSAFASQSGCRLKIDPAQWRHLDGACSDGLANGRGRAMNRAGNEAYIGEFKDGLPHGKGILGSYYHGKRYYFYGQFKQGILDGRGSLQVRSKAYRHRLGGRWKDGRPHGKLMASIQYSGVLGVKNNMNDFENGCITASDGRPLTRTKLKGQEFCNKLNNPVQAGLTNKILLAKKRTTSPVANQAQQQAKVSNGSPEQRLEKLNRLHKKGLISRADYETKKQEILKEL